MPFCDVSEVVPKSLMAVIPDRYKTMRYHKLMAGETITIYDITVVSFHAKKDGEPLNRKDGSPVLNQTIYLDIGNGVYTTVRNDKVLGQVAYLTGWVEDGIGEKYYKLENPETVQVIEIPVKMGSKDYPVKAFKSIQ